MPELAEVEFFRKQWEPGRGGVVTGVALGAGSRVFRQCDVSALGKGIRGACLVDSETHGKRLLFRFRGENGGSLWLGLHMGMTGKLFTAPVPHRPAKHEHLVLFQSERALVFDDPRQFGRVDFARGEEVPAWWHDLPPAILSAGFTVRRVEAFLERHRRSSIKAVLLMQEGFPGLGNWMVDEILWQAGIWPGRLAGELQVEERKKLVRKIKAITRIALRTIGEDFRDPPEAWMFHQRWKKGGICPRTGTPLIYETIAGRTTCWSPAVQRR